MTNTTTYRITFSGDTVRQHGLTVDSVRAMLAGGEWPLDVVTEVNWMGLPMVVCYMTAEQDEVGDASAAELIEVAERTGLPHWVAYL